jgi:hypothetical protein
MDFIENLEGGLTAVRYGTPDGRWEQHALVKIAAFITGVDINKDSMTEDQLLDVVRPVKSFWDPARGSADIEVITGKRILGMTLGQWLVRYPDGFYRVLSNNDYLSQVGPGIPAKSFRQELQELLNKHSIDARTNTPDFVLANFVIGVLNNLENAVKAVKEWETN